MKVSLPPAQRAHRLSSTRRLIQLARFSLGLLSLGLLPLWLLGCAGSPAESQTPGATDAAGTVTTGPEAECLANAAAPRTPPSDAPETIRVSHILVRHKELERPEGATRTRGAACLSALSALEGLQSGEEWNTVVDDYSDSGQSTHGDLGRISKEDVTGLFADAAFSLDENELSYVVETDRGFHIILRTE